MKLEQLIEELMTDDEFARSYNAVAPEFDIAHQVVQRRRELGWSQAELAERAGTKQANISRLERAVGHPTLSLLKRVAAALGVELRVELRPGSSAEQRLDQGWHTAPAELLAYAKLSTGVLADSPYMQWPATAKHSGIARTGEWIGILGSKNTIAPPVQEAG